MFVFDLLLLVGLTARLMRLVTTDDLFIETREAVERWAKPRVHQAARSEVEYVEDPVTAWRRQWWADALVCVFCSGYWMGAVTLASLYLAGGPGHAADMWRYIAGSFALNYVAAHISARLDQ